ncbi:MAG: glycosyltransferase [Pseudomonadota bacterium]
MMAPTLIPALVPALVLALVSAALWAGMLVFWHGFWRADRRLPGAAAAPADGWPGVVAVIPARNEAATIGEVVAAHRATAYAGPFAVVVVDDASADGTAALARAAGAPGPGGPVVEVAAAPPLRPGWSGKMGAVAAGIEAAEAAIAAGRLPEARYWLLTDADIVHAPETLARLVALAGREDRVLVSLMARLATAPGLPRLLVAAYVFFFQKLYPFPAVGDPASRIAGAAGGCMLVERHALARAGGIAAIRDALIDDCALAALLKRRGGRLWLGLADDEVVSRRDTGRIATLWETVVRTAYVQLGRSPLALAGCVAGMGLLYLAGPLALVAGLVAGAPAPALAGALAWGLMATAFHPTLRLYGGGWRGALMLPVAAMLYTAMTLDSARRDLLGRGAPWKGRSYPATPGRP